MRFTRIDSKLQGRYIVNQDELDLIIQARLGTNEGMNEMFTRYRPLIRKVWQQYYVTDLELDDWTQEAKLVMVKALRSYQWRSLDEFGGFYKQSLVNRILDLYRARQAYKRIPANKIAPLCKEHVESLADGHHSSLDELIYCHECLQQFMSNCSDFERQVIALLHTGLTTGELADQLSCSERKVQSALTRSRHKLVRALQN